MQFSENVLKELAIELFFIGTLANKLCSDDKQLGVGTIVREVACICHHAGEQALRRFSVDEVEQLEAAEEDGKGGMP